MPSKTAKQLREEIRPRAYTTPGLELGDYLVTYNRSARRLTTQFRKGDRIIKDQKRLGQVIERFTGEILEQIGVFSVPATGGNLDALWQWLCEIDDNASAMKLERIFPCHFRSSQPTRV